MEDDSEKSPDYMSTVASKAPITAKHKIRSDLEKSIPKPYLARALVCPDTDHPKGNLPVKNSDMTVLQQHVAFFDPDGDGIIYPWDIYEGMRSVGSGRILAFSACIVVSVLISNPSLPGWLPSPTLPIYIKNIHRTLHGSDSGTFDSEGRFIPAYFENMFSKYAHTEPDKFTLWELLKMLTGHRKAYDLVGRFSNLMEWGVLFYLAADENWMLSKEDIRNCYDGTLFEQLARQRQDRKQLLPPILNIGRFGEKLTY